MFLACAALVLPSQDARADCALIPLALKELRSTQGTVDRALARPGDTVTVRVDLACSPDQTGFDPILANNEITLRFEPPTGGANATDVAVVPSEVTNCGTVQTARCDTLRFVVPDTDDLLAPAADGKGLVGTARILVTGTGGSPSLAEVGPLFEPTLSCTDQRPDGVFEHFTVLSNATLFDAGTTEVLGTLDGGGNLLIHWDFSNVLPADPGSPLFILLEGTADILAFTGAPGQFVRLPDKRFIRAFNVAGRPLPPFLETNGVGDKILGSVDATDSVIRISRLDPDAPLDPPLYDLTDRLLANKGPVEITLVTPLNALAVAPLESLTATGQMLAFAEDEAIVGDQNADSDTGDQFVYVVDQTDASVVGTNRAVVEVSTEELDDFGLQAEADLVAFLESEAHAQTDLNSDNDQFDSMLRAYSSDGTNLTASLDVTADPTPVINGRPLAVSNDFVFFRTREGTELPRLTERVSVGPAGLQADGTSDEPALDGSGRYVAFSSEATNLLGAGIDTNGVEDVFVHDRDTGTTVRVSVSGAGVQANGASVSPDITPDGRFVTFRSFASNLVSGDSFANRDVFVHDRDTDTDGIFDEAGAISTVRVSVSTAGLENSFNSGAGAISADGRFVSFHNAASTLVAGDTNSDNDVFVRDRDTDEDGIFDEVGAVATLRVSVSDAGAQGDAGSEISGLSADGRFVTFRSGASNFAGAQVGAYDFFLHDRDTDEDGAFDEPGAISTVRVWEVTDPEEDGPLVISGNGRFTSVQLQESESAFVYDRISLGVDPLASNTNGDALNAGIFSTEDEGATDFLGRFVVLRSAATNVVPGDTNGVSDLFVFDRTTNVAERVSLTTAGAQVSVSTGSGNAMSDDGHFTAFVSFDTTLVPGDNNVATDVFVRGIDTTTAVSLNSADSDVSDSVLQVFARSGQALRPNARVAASQVAVAAGRAVVLTPESQEGETNLNSGGGDGDADDSVAQLYDANLDSLTNLGVAASRIAISGDVVCLTVPEDDENETDRNGDADTADDVLAVWDISAPGLANVMAAAADVGAIGERCVFITPEAGQGASGTDLNADSDTADRVIRIYDDADPAPLPQNRISEIAQAAEDFQLDGNRIAFRTCEADQNNTDLNNDGDTVDCVMQVYDFVSETLINTNRAASLCDFPGCDPFFEPYRLQGDNIAFVTFEADQGGVSPGTGCFPTATPGECDLTGDGNDNDVVLHVFNLISLRAQVYELSLNPPPEDIAPFPDGNMLHIQVPEATLGEDINGDMSIDGTLVTVIMGDTDGDGTFDESLSNGDVCIEDPNVLQIDVDGDQLGDTCDINQASVLPGATPCDANLDAAIDQVDVDIILRDVGMLARDPDGRDPDLDGQITSTDAQFCANQCDVPANCSVPVCGNGILELLGGEECDDGNMTAEDGCASCEVESIWHFEGEQTSFFPGFVSFEIDGIQGSIGTFQGYTSDTLAAAVAAAINGSGTLAALGVTATVVENRVITNGTVSNVVISDAGLGHKTAQCQDGLDNDGDGSTDSDDPDCIDPSDHLEADVAFGDILVVNFGAAGNGSVVKVDPVSGVQTVLFDTLDLADPAGIAVSEVDSPVVLVSDFANDRILEFDLATGNRSILSSGSLINAPMGIAVEESGDLWVLNASLITLVDGVTGAQSFLTNFNTGWAVAVEASGDLVATRNPGTARLRRIDSSTGDKVTIPATLTAPHGLGIDDSGDLIVADSGASAVVRVDPVTGDTTTISSGSFSALQGLTIEVSGQILVVDAGTVKRVDPTTGSAVTLATGGSLDDPRGLAILRTDPPNLPSGSLGTWLALVLLMMATASRRLLRGRSGQGG